MTCLQESDKKWLCDNCLKLVDASALQSISLKDKLRRREKRRQEKGPDILLHLDRKDILRDFNNFSSTRGVPEKIHKHIKSHGIVKEEAILALCSRPCME